MGVGNYTQVAIQRSKAKVSQRPANFYLVNKHHLILTISVRADGIFCEYCSSQDGPRTQSCERYWWCRLNSRAEIVVQVIQMVVQHHH